jgi:hypothetical protein
VVFGVEIHIDQRKTRTRISKGIFGRLRIERYCSCQSRSMHGHKVRTNDDESTTHKPNHQPSSVMHSCLVSSLTTDGPTKITHAKSSSHFLAHFHSWICKVSPKSVSTNKQTNKQTNKHDSLAFDGQTQTPSSRHITSNK